MSSVPRAWTSRKTMLNSAAVKATEHGVHASFVPGDIRNCSVFLKNGSAAAGRPVGTWLVFRGEGEVNTTLPQA
jgi:hypothetical protein